MVVKKMKNTLTKLSSHSSSSSRVGKREKSKKATSIAKKTLLLFLFATLLDIYLQDGYILMSFVDNNDTNQSLSSFSIQKFLWGAADQTRRQMMTTTSHLRPTQISSSNTPSYHSYNQSTITKTLSQMELIKPRLLLYDGSTQSFQIYNINPTSDKMANYKPIVEHCDRCTKIIPLLVQALQTRYLSLESVDRNKSFQIVFSVADSVQATCMDDLERKKGGGRRRQVLSHGAAKEERKRKCVQKEKSNEFAPILFFGSTMEDEEILPSVATMPNHFYVKCIYDWLNRRSSDDVQGNELCSQFVKLSFYNNENERSQTNQQTEISPTSWNDLIPQVIWRGSDFRFLNHDVEFQHLKRKPYEPPQPFISKRDLARELLRDWDNLRPRWRAVALSLEAEANVETKNGYDDDDDDDHLAWIDAKFVGPTNAAWHAKYQSPSSTSSTSLVASQEYMTQETLSTYKYHIDLGGGGGTTWTGTLTKLLLPGVLFHHETPTKDWFYKYMKPWVHYIPISWDLSDLKGRYDWAEDHPHDCKTIALEGTKLAKWILSRKYGVEEVYEKDIVDNLIQVAQSYRQEDETKKQEEETTESILQQYQADGFVPYLLSTCDDKSCSTEIHVEGYYEQCVYPERSSQDDGQQQEEMGTNKPSCVNVQGRGQQPLHNNAPQEIM